MLLYAGGQRGLRGKASGRDQAGSARDPEGGGSLRERAGARRTDARRWWVHPALRLCAAGASGASLRQVARIRPRRHNALLRPAPARRGFIKSSPRKIIAGGTDWRFLDELKR